MKATKTLEDLLPEIDRQKNILDRLKTFFSHMGDSVIGQTTIIPGKYYTRKGLDVTILFNRPLTREDVTRNNEISRWLNESFIIRLFALLNSYGIYHGRIDPTSVGKDEVDILRNLRNILAHSSGKYHPDDSDQKKLVQRIVTRMKLRIEEPEEFPLDIDKVIDPLIEGCKKYIQAKIQTVMKGGEPGSSIGSTTLERKG